MAQNLANIFSMKPRKPHRIIREERDNGETFEKCSISFKIKTHEDFNHRNILNISRIKIRMQRRDWAKGDVFQRSHNGFTLIEVLVAIVILSVGLLGMASLTVAIIQGNKFSNDLTTATTLA